MAAPLYVTQSGRLWHAGLILIVTVGLPGGYLPSRGFQSNSRSSPSEVTANATARGKTHISRALERYLRWLGVKTRVYSLGDYRRKVLGGAEKIPADYFQTDEPRSEATNALRRRIKGEIEDQIWDFFTVQGGQVVIYDANNGTAEQRKKTLERFESKGVHVIFLGTSTPVLASRHARTMAKTQKAYVIGRTSSLLTSAPSSCPLQT